MIARRNDIKTPSRCKMYSYNAGTYINSSFGMNYDHWVTANSKNYSIFLVDSKYWRR